jgi:hypothetical protein
MDFFRNFPFAEVLFFALGLSMSVPGLIWAWDGLVLAQGHERTVGEHVSSRAKSGTTESGMFGEDRRTVTVTIDVVEFTTEDGETVEVETTVPDEYEYGEVPLIYAPDSPKTVCIEPCESLETGGLLFGAGVFSLVVGFGLRLRRTSEE